jgi:hypothetical protein
MVMAADQLLRQAPALAFSHALLHALWSEERDIRLAGFGTQRTVADSWGRDEDLGIDRPGDSTAGVGVL